MHRETPKDWIWGFAYLMLCGCGYLLFNWDDLAAIWEGLTHP